MKHHRTNGPDWWIYLRSDKFQAISVGKKTYATMKNIQIAEVYITCEEIVKLLGVELDYKLNFDTQLTAECFTETK